MAQEHNAMVSLQFVFTPESFHLDTVSKGDAGDAKRWEMEFQEDRYAALYQLGFQDHIEGLSQSARFLQVLAVSYMEALTSHSELELAREQVEVPISEEMLEHLSQAIPFAIGVEYINKEWMEGIFEQLTKVFAQEIMRYHGSVRMYLAEKSQHLQVAQRIFFHLVEDGGEDFPFAFLVTYATRDEEGSIRHMPLKYALIEFKNDRNKLISLLSCLNKAAEVSPLLASFMEKGELFHPLGLLAEEAYEFLKSIEKFEACGIMCRVPNWWKKKYASVSLSVQMGDQKPSMLGFDALLQMQPALRVNGRVLSKVEIQQLLEQTEGLALLKGKWVEVDHDKLRKLLEEMESYGGMITMRDALRMNMELTEEDKDADGGVVMSNGAWLHQLLANLRTPSKMEKYTVPDTFHAVLRPYQQSGYSWLSYMNELGFGACLADDMGLGKTVQVLAYLDSLRQQQPDAKILLIVPASLLGNWEKEVKRFAPAIDMSILHGKTSALLAEELQEQMHFLTITTYGIAAHLTLLQDTVWTCIILDEAQAIKNPLTKQTKAVKKLSSQMRIAMTGTPIENELSNLWSLFDFLNKGLLGGAKEFQRFAKKMDEHPEISNKLKSMVSPFILRRLKSDRTIISDLPEKLETVDYVKLNRKQVVLYRKLMAQMEVKIQESDGMARRGLVLSTITKLKQICNHPDQYLGQQDFVPKDSGKFGVLRELCETIYEKRERVLVFTQYREITEQLSNFLETIFHKRGFVLHGGTSVKNRTKIVEEFNGEAYIPYIVLSVKAGGTGLNLTSANHVIHFDRWWNPAVENQASDRAYRIGQTKNVMVHKLVCEGTIEEKINELINSKKALADNIIGARGEQWITEFSNEELMSMLRLEE